MLGNELYQHICLIAPKLLPATTLIIQRWLSGVETHQRQDLIESAIMEVFKERLELLEQVGVPLIAQLTAPFLTWGLTQDWKNHIPMQRALECWHHHLKASTNTPRISFLPACPSMFSNIAELFPHLDTAQAQLLTAFWTQNLLGGNIAYTLELKMRAPWISSQIVLGRMSIYCTDAKTNSPGTPSSLKCWERSLKHSFSKMEDSFVSQTLLAFLHSDLGQTTKIKVCKQASASAWLSPTIIEHLSPLLPSNSVAKYTILPWMSVSKDRHQPALVNQEMAQLYTPDIAMLLNSIGGDDVWKDRNKVMSIINGMSPTAVANTLANSYASAEVNVLFDLD